MPRPRVAEKRAALCSVESVDSLHGTLFFEGFACHHGLSARDMRVKTCPVYFGGACSLNPAPCNGKVPSPTMAVVATETMRRCGQECDQVTTQPLATFRAKGSRSTMLSALRANGSRLCGHEHVACIWSPALLTYANVMAA